MSEDTQATQALKQTADLFKKNEAVVERVTKIESAMITQQQASAEIKSMCKAINENNQRLDQTHNDFQIVILGDDKLGVKGLVKETQEQGKIIAKYQMYILASGVTLALLKYFGVLDNLPF